MPQFDGESLLITLDSGVTTVDVQADLYETWKEWMLASPANRGFPAAFRTIGGDPLTATLAAGAYFFLDNAAGWRIKPPEEDITIAVTGNLAAEDITLPILVPTIGDFSVMIIGLQPVTQGVSPSGVASAVWDVDHTEHETVGSTGEILSHIEYLEHHIYIDTEALVNGKGTQESPFNDLSDAVDSAESHNIKSLVVMADIMIDRLLKGFKIIGIGIPTIDCNGQNLNKSEFVHCRMEGSYLGEITVQQCALLNNFQLNGFFENCGLAGDLFCVDGASILVKDCASMMPGTTNPTISMNSGGISYLNVRAYSGGLTIKDADNASDTVTVEIVSGSMVFDSSCVAGDMIARGTCKFTDETAGATVTDETINPVSIADQVWDESSADHVQAGSLGQAMKLIKDIEGGQWEIVGNQMIFYEDDNTTEVARFNLTNQGGAPAMTDIYKRARV